MRARAALVVAAVLAGCGGGSDDAPDDAPRLAALPEPGLLRRLLGGGEPAYEDAICGRPDIAGTAIGPVEGRGACGIPQAVRVRAVAGVALSTPATVNCETAATLADWVRAGAQPAFDGAVTELRVAASYACRTRNHRRGARLSEHSFGNAIDISGFALESGEVVTVRQGWGASGTSAPLRAAWRAACGPFGTVLGPASDRFHLDHFHLDVADHRSGPYCR